MGLCAGECLLWNPSVTPPACQLPLTREPLGCTDQSPPCQRGVVWQSQTGGIPRAGRFPHGFVLSRSANCESLRQKSLIFASSLWQGSRGQCPLTMRTGFFCESLLPLQCPVSAACPPNLFTIHSSLFTKNARYRWLGKIPLCQRRKLFFGGTGAKEPSGA